MVNITVQSLACTVRTAVWMRHSICPKQPGPQPVVIDLVGATSHQGRQLIRKSPVDLILLCVLVLKLLHRQGQLCHSGGRSKRGEWGTCLPQFLKFTSICPLPLRLPKLNKDPRIYLPRYGTWSKSLLTWGPLISQLQNGNEVAAGCIS